MCPPRRRSRLGRLADGADVSAVVVTRHAVRDAAAPRIGDASGPGGGAFRSSRGDIGVVSWLRARSGRQRGLVRARRAARPFPGSSEPAGPASASPA